MCDVCHVYVTFVKVQLQMGGHSTDLQLLSCIDVSSNEHALRVGFGGCPNPNLDLEVKMFDCTLLIITFIYQLREWNGEVIRKMPDMLQVNRASV